MAERSVGSRLQTRPTSPRRVIHYRLVLAADDDWPRRPPTAPLGRESFAAAGAAGFSFGFAFAGLVATCRAGTA